MKPDGIVVPFAVFVEYRERLQRIAAALRQSAGIDPVEAAASASAAAEATADPALLVLVKRVVDQPK